MKKNQVIIANVLCTLFLLMNGCVRVAGKPNVTRQSKAVDWLAAQVSEYSKRLYVYADYSDSRNAFTQRGFMGDATEPVLDEASPLAYSGITSIKVTAPIESGRWSGFVFANGILVQGSTVPLMDWGAHDAGLNLTGAKKLVVHARAADGEAVFAEFKMGTIGGKYPDSGTKSSGLVTLSDRWKSIEIDLSGVNLSRIAGGFTFLINDHNRDKKSVTIYIDEVYYEFETPRSEPVFLSSYEPAPLDKAGSFINSFAYSYDAAMTVLALAYGGKKEEALKVADGLLFAFDNDRKFSSAERGVRNGYASGDPSSYPGWYSASGKSPFARLAGTFDLKENIWKEDQYSDSYSTGNSAWALLAFLKAYDVSKENKYIEVARRLADHLHTLRDDINGGFTGGFDGFDDRQTKATYASTEHNIDLYSAFMQLGNVVGKTDKTAAQPYYDDAEHARTFVFRMYNAEGFFDTGTKDDGVSINREIHPLDVNTWALHAFYQEPGFDAEKVMAYIETNLRDTESGFYKFSDKTIAGYWVEGSYQKIVADLLLGYVEKYEQQLARLDSEAQSNGSIVASNIDGLKTGFYLKDSSEWIYYKRIHTGATSWKALAELGVNVLAPDLYLNDEAGIHPASSVSLNAYINNGVVYVSGLETGEIVYFYSILGRLLKQLTNSTGGIISYPVPHAEQLLIVKGSSGRTKKLTAAECM